MFGMTMRIEYDGFGIILRACKREEIQELVPGFSSMVIHRYTTQLFAQTLENEQEWYDHQRQSKDEVTWVIVPDGSLVPVGVTSLHHIDIFGSCTSGIVIWDQNWWGKGVASRAHLGRTLFAADYLNRSTINSQIRTVNEASLKAAIGVGYIVTGVQPRSAFRDGRYLDTYNLTWLNPERISILYPEGLPSQYKEGVERARAALIKARAIVSWV